MIRGDQPGGRFALIEHTIPPRGLAEAMGAIRARYRLTMDFESIEVLSERFGLSR